MENILAYCKIIQVSECFAIKHHKTTNNCKIENQLAYNKSKNHSTQFTVTNQRNLDPDAVVVVAFFPHSHTPAASQR